MSRFSKAEAEARGWVFVHERAQHDIVTSETQGESRTVPATFRAEKYVTYPDRGSTLINEEAESTGKLLERISAYEAQLEQKAIETTPTIVPEETQPRNEVGDVVKSVITRDADGNVVYLTDDEYSSRSRTDSIFDGEKMIHYGPVEEAAESDVAREELSNDKENLRAAEADVGPTKQVTYDTADRIDSPGQGAGGVLIVREDEDTLGDVSRRKEAESVAQETRRLVDTTEVPFERIPSPEGQDELAGVDVGIQHRGDLDSERPREGQTAEAAANPPEDLPLRATETAADIRLDATEEKAKEIRDEDGRKEADEVGGRSEAIEAGAAAEQDVADEAQEDADDGDVDTSESTGGESDAEAPASASENAGDVQEEQSAPSAPDVTGLGTPVPGQAQEYDDSDAQNPESE